MADYTMNDAAFFNTDMLGAQVIAGYIGGSNADNTWSDANWSSVGTKPKLPIWVPAPAATAADARSEVLAILSIILHHRMPPGQVIAFDLETSGDDYSYIQEMAGCLVFFNNYGTLAYGSRSTIQNAVPGSIWKWDADWDNGGAHLTPGMEATQWTNGTTFDQSLISQALYDRLLWR